MTDEVKTCVKCGKIKPVSDFPWAQTDVYRRTDCRDCKNAYNALRRVALAQQEGVRRRGRYMERRDVELAAARARYRANPERSKATAARRRLRLDALRNDMDVESIGISIAYRKAIKDDPCFYCGERAEVMHDDHVTPLSRGGTDHWWNIVRACASCNLRKAAKSADQFLHELAGWRML